METISREALQYYYSMQNQLKDHIYRREQKYFDKAKKTRAAISTVEELSAYNKEMKEKFISNIGGIPESDVPFDAEIRAVREYDEYRIENIIFKSRKGTYITSSMYIPHGLTEKSAALLFVHGHSDDTRHYPAYQIACDTFARAGLIVFAIDPVGQGERVSYFDDEKNDYIVPPCVEDHDAAGIPAIATDRFAASYFLSDEKRALDYMLTRPEIDPARIGVTGNSGGGTQTMVMMAVDDRIAAAAPGTFVTSRESYMYSGQPQDCEQIWYRATEMGYDHINPIMNFAPKPLAILSVNYDFFTIEGTMDTIEEAKRYYAMYGKEENLAWFRDDSLHEYTPNLSRMAAQFFAKHLLGKDIEISNENYKMKPYSDFFCTKSGRVRGEIADARFLYDENVDRAKYLYEKRHSLPDEERKRRAKEWLREKVYAFREPCSFNIRKLSRIKSEGCIVQPCFWRSQKDVFNFASIIVKEELFDKKLPVIIALWKDGNKALEEHGDWIRNKCDEGYRVVVLDYVGEGLIEAAEINAYPSKYEKYATFYKLCCDMLYIGDSLAAMRTWDVIRATEMISEIYGVEKENQTIFCESQYGIYGALAAFVDGKVKVEYADKLAGSIEKDMIDVFAKEYNDDYSIIIPGMLSYFDYDEIKNS